MKGAKLLFSIVIVIGFLIPLGANDSYSQTHPEYAKVDESKVAKEKVALAKQYAEAYYNAMFKGGTCTFIAENSIEMMAKMLTPENLEKGKSQVESLFGEYQSMAYAETWSMTGPADLTIVRFKADFSESRKKLEIRVVLNADNKVAGFWLRPWSDVFA